MPAAKPRTVALLAWIALPAQTVICGFVLFCVAMVFFAAGGVYDGLDTLFGAALIAAVTTIAAIVVGLILRAIPPLRRAWLRHGDVTIAVLTLAGFVIMLSYTTIGSGWQENPAIPDEAVPASAGFYPNETIFAVGWCLLAVALTHLWLPRGLMTRSLRAAVDQTPFGQDRRGGQDASTARAHSYPCVCCGYLTLDDVPGSYAICPICFWEDDAAQLADPVNGGGANRVSLVEAQANYWAHGTSEPRLAQFVRQPTGDDVREFGWRPIDPRLDDFSREKAKPWPDDPTVLYWWRPTSRVGRDA